jgi:SAM-dependent methyltransferase
MKLNIGSNNKIVEGFINLDILDLPNVDAFCELGQTPYVFRIKPDRVSKFGGIEPVGDLDNKFYKNTIDEIVAIEFLEHISFRETENVLREWYRILKPGGVLNIQVPDADKAMRYYVNGEVCDCVPHKSEGIYAADAKCFKCGGKGKINTDRWLFTFTGAQKHKWDCHLNIFTPKTIERYLSFIGFRNIKIKDDIYKIKVVCLK